MLPELTQDEFSGALDAVATDALGALPDAQPPIDALALASALRLAVAWDDQQSGRGRVVRLSASRGSGPNASIMLKPDERPERLQWAIAHEIGETCAHQVFDRLGIDPREAPLGAREKVANYLAGRILLPAEWFSADARTCDWDLLLLKERYLTASHELIARRMLDFEPRVAIAIVDQGRRTFRRANFAGRLPSWESQEAPAWRVAHDEARVVELSDERCRVRAWPIHEVEWKREILRTEWQFAEYADDGC